MFRHRYLSGFVAQISLDWVSERVNLAWKGSTEFGENDTGMLPNLRFKGGEKAKIGRQPGTVLDNFYILHG